MKKIRIGIFGIGRGMDFVANFEANGAEVVSLFDGNEEKLKAACAYYTKGKASTFTNYDEFLDSGVDAILLANPFHEHTPYAIKALEKGIHVLSECTSNSTMAEGVALVRAAEKSNAFYMLAENYPFMRFNQEMRRVYRSGNLGKFLFGEGEYNHPGNPGRGSHDLNPYPKHWRNYNPATYYITHSLAPLMFITGAFPKRVSAFPVYAPYYDAEALGSQTGDRAAIVTCLNDDDSVYRVVGCSKFGAHENSYRICGTKGQIENVRGGEDKVMLRYNDWDIPEGEKECNYYLPEWPEGYAEAAEKAGHGGGDFFIAKEFLDCIREGRRPEFDEYFATTCASVAILAHRSILNGNIPYDIPDFRKEEDRVKYEDDHISPFYYSDGREPNIPCSSHPGYHPSEKQFNNYLEDLGLL